MNRRRFLTTVGGLAAASLLPAVPAAVRGDELPAPELTQEQMLAIIANGLGKTARPQEVVVVGAGMAGLVAAYELLRAGHKPTVLEAQQRVGGRVRTLREPFAHGLYAEAGAMRLPAAHKLVRAYVANAPDRGAARLETMPFTWGNPNGYCFLRNQRHRWKEIAANPDLLGYDLTDRRPEGGLDERHKTPTQLWEETVRPLRELLHREGPAAWKTIVEKYDRYSTRGFLELHHWSPEAITMFGDVENQLARLNNGVVELLREKLTGSFEDLVQIKGGMDLLPRSFLPRLERHIRFGAKLEALEQSGDKVTVHYHDVTYGRRSVLADRAVITLPFTMLRHVEGIETFSHAKQLAIRGLNYNESGKILLQCRRRFWEEDDKIVGGYSQTDLSIRNLWYPEHGQETGRGVLLVSYTWGRDSQSWSHLPPDERIRQAVEGLMRIHPQVAKEDLIEGGTSVMWQNEPWAGGAFCLFNPTQESRLHRPIRQVEGRFHFAGEHTSLNHRWIEGAVESALRAAHEVHHART